MDVKKFVDAKGFACPMPVVRVRKEINELEAGDILEVHATDKGSVSDLTAWSKSGGHEVVKQEEAEGVFKFWIQKGN